MSRRRVGLEAIRKKLTQDSNHFVATMLRDPVKTSAQEDFARVFPRAQSVGHREDEPKSPLREQPLTLAYTLQRGQQQLFFLLRTHKVAVGGVLRDSITKVFDEMGAALKDAAVSFELGRQGKTRNLAGSEFQKGLTDIDSEFAQARQALRLSDKLVTIQLDKIELGLNSLKSTMRIDGRRDDSYSRFNTYAAVPHGGRSSSQSNRERAESASTGRVAGLQKDLGKLAAEVTKMAGKVKLYEEIFARKDAAAQSLLAAYKDACDTQTFSDADSQLIRKDEEIRRLRADLETQKAEARRVQAQPSERDSSRLERVCTEASSFLAVMEKLKRIIIKRDDASIDRTRQELETRRKALSSLLTSSRSSGGCLGRYKVSRETGTSENSIQEILSLQRKRRELEVQCSGQAEELGRYQSSLLEHVERLKRKDREIESLQQELISYRERIQTLQDECGRDRTLDRPLETLASLPAFELFKESAASMCAAYEGLGSNLRHRLATLAESLQTVQDKVKDCRSAITVGRTSAHADHAQEEENRRLAERNQELERENESLRAKLSEREKALEPLQDENTALRNAVDTQTADAKDYITQMASIMKESFQKREEELIALLGEKAARVDSVKESFEAVLSLLSSQINEQVENIEQLREENESLKQGQSDQGSFKHAEDELKGQLAALKEELRAKERLAAELPSLKQAWKEADERVQKERQDRERAEARVAELEEERQRCVEDLRGYAEKQEEMGESLARVAGMVTAGVRVAEESFEGYGRMKERMIGVMKPTLVKLKARSAARYDELRQREAVLEDLREKLKQRDSEVFSLQEQLRTAEESAEKLQSDLVQQDEHAKTRADAQDKEIQMLKSQCEMKESEVEELTTVKKLLNDEKSELENRCRLLQQNSADTTALETEKAKSHVLAEERDKTRAEVDRLNEELKKVSDENWKMSEDMYEKDDRVSKLKEQLRTVKTEILDRVKGLSGDYAKFRLVVVPMISQVSLEIASQFSDQIRAVFSTRVSQLSRKTASSLSKAMGITSALRTMLAEVTSAHAAYAQDYSNGASDVKEKVRRMADLSAENEQQAEYLLVEAHDRMAGVCEDIGEASRSGCATLAEGIAGIRSEFASSVEKTKEEIMDRVRDVMRKICEENRSLRGQVVQLTGSMEGKGKELGVLLGEKETTIRELTQRLETSEAQAEKSRTELAALSQKLSQSVSAAEEAEQKLVRTQTELAETKQALEGQNTALSVRLDEEKKSAILLETQHKSEIAGVDAENKRLQDELANVQKLKTECDLALEESKKTSMVISAQLDEEKKTVEQHKGEIAGLETQNATLREELEKAQKERESALEESKKATASLTVQLDEEKKVAAQIETRHKGEMAELESDRKRLQDELAAVREGAQKQKAESDLALEESKKSSTVLTMKLEQEKIRTAELDGERKNELEVENKRLHDELEKQKADSALTLEEEKKSGSTIALQLGEEKKRAEERDAKGKEELAGIDARNGKLQEELEQAQATILKQQKDYEAALEEEKKSAAALGVQFEEEKKKMAEQGEVLVGLEVKNKKLQEDFDLAQSATEKQKSDYEAALEENKKVHTALSAQNAQLSGLLDEERKRAAQSIDMSESQCKTQLATLQSDTAKLKEDLIRAQADLQKQKEDHEAALGESRKTNIALASEKAKLAEQLDVERKKSEQSLSLSESQYKASNAEKEKLQLELAETKTESQKQTQEAEQRIALAESQHKKELDIAHDKSQEDVLKLKADFEAQLAQDEKLHNETEERLKAQNAQLEEEKSKQEQRLVALQTENTQLHEELSQKSAEAQQITVALSAREKDSGSALQERETKIQSLSDELRSAKAEQNKSAQQVETLNLHVTQLSQEKDKLQSELETKCAAAEKEVRRLDSLSKERDAVLTAEKEARVKETQELRLLVDKLRKKCDGYETGIKDRDLRLQELSKTATANEERSQKQIAELRFQLDSEAKSKDEKVVVITREKADLELAQTASLEEAKRLETALNAKIAEGAALEKENAELRQTAVKEREETAKGASELQAHMQELVKQLEMSQENEKGQSAALETCRRNIQIIKSRLLPRISELQSRFIEGLALQPQIEKAASVVARVEETVLGFCTRLRSVRDKDRMKIQNYQTMMRDSQESTEKYQTSFQQARDKLAKLEQEANGARAALTKATARRKAGESDIKAAVETVAAATQERILDLDNAADMRLTGFEERISTLTRVANERTKKLREQREDAKTVLVQILRTQGRGEETMSLQEACETIRDLFASQKAEVERGKKSRAVLLAQMGPRISSIAEQFLQPVLAGVERASENLTALEIGKESLQEAVQSLLMDREGLRQTLANTKNDLSVFAARTEKEAAEQQEKIKELTEIVESNAKVMDKANEELAKAIEDYGITLDEQQKCSLDELVRTILSLMEMLSKRENEKEEEEHKAGKTDDLVLDDDDFGVGLVEEIGSGSGAESKLSQRAEPPPEKKSEEDKKPSEDWKAREAQLLQRISDLEHSNEIKDSSDRHWHVDYEEIKEGIRKLVERYDPSKGECTMAQVEAVVERLATQTEKLQNEKEENQRAIVELNQKIMEKAAEIERLKVGMGQSQKDVAEQKKAVLCQIERKVIDGRFDHELRGEAGTGSGREVRDPAECRRHQGRL